MIMNNIMMFPSLSLPGNQAPGNTGNHPYKLFARFEEHMCYTSCVRQVVLLLLLLLLHIHTNNDNNSNNHITIIIIIYIYPN